MHSYAVRTLARAAVCAITASGSVSAQAALTSAQWREDVRFASAELIRIHPALFARAARVSFDSIVRSLEMRADHASPAEMLVGFASLFAFARDAHTSLWPGADAVTRLEYLPIRLYWYDDGIFVQAAAPEYASIVGARVTHIASQPVESLFAAMRPVISADNEFGFRDFVPLRAIRPQALRALGLAQDTTSVSFGISRANERVDVAIHPMGLEANGVPRQTGIWGGMGAAPGGGWIDARTSRAAPLWLTRQRDAYWNAYLDSVQVMYVQYNSIVDTGEERVEDFFQRVIQDAASRNARRLVIDLRLNGGGSNDLNRAVVRQILRSPFNTRGKLFALIGRRTFSAAQNLVNELEKYSEVIFAGEPTAGRPNHFGDAVTVTLPNSRFQGRVSTVTWQDMGPRDRRTFTAPELAIDLRSDDYANGRDPVLEAVVQFEKHTTLADVLHSGAERNLGALRRQLDDFRGDRVNRYVNPGMPLTAFATKIARSGDAVTALAMQSWNAEWNAEDPRVWSALGDIAVLARDTTRAVSAYERALRLAPQFPGVAEKRASLLRPPGEEREARIEGIRPYS